VFRETPAGELIEANCHAWLNCSKQLLNGIIFFRFSDKKLFTLVTLKIHRTTNCKNLLSQRIKTLIQNAVLAHSDGDRHVSKYYCESVTFFCHCHNSCCLPYFMSLANLFFQKTVPNHIENAMFSDINISQGSVETSLSCGEICNDLFCCKFPIERNNEYRTIYCEDMDKSLVWCLVFWLTVYKHTRFAFNVHVCRLFIFTFNETLKHFVSVPIYSKTWRPPRKAEGKHRLIPPRSPSIWPMHETTVIAVTRIAVTREWVSEWVSKQHFYDTLDKQWVISERKLRSTTWPGYTCMNALYVTAKRLQQIAVWTFFKV